MNNLLKLKWLVCKSKGVRILCIYMTVQFFTLRCTVQQCANHKILVYVCFNMHRFSRMILIVDSRDGNWTFLNSRRRDFLLRLLVLLFVRGKWKSWHMRKFMLRWIQKFQFYPVITWSSPVSWSTLHKTWVNQKYCSFNIFLSIR